VTTLDQTRLAVHLSDARHTAPSPDQPYAVVLDGRAATDARPTLPTDPFTWVRAGMGRRTREEVLALDWSANPTGVLPALFVFGPSATPLGEQPPS
jgi:hypothetical protein